MFSGREQGPGLMNRTPSFSSILLFSFDAEAVRIFFRTASVFLYNSCHLTTILCGGTLAEFSRNLYNIC